jgi:hypothetical protein
VAFDGYGHAILAFSESSLYNWFDHSGVDFEPYVFHDYSLTTSDLVTYTVTIDGTFAFSAQFYTPCFGSWADWGDSPAIS